MIWIPLWIVCIGSITAGGAIDDALARKPSWYVAWGLVSGVLCALFVAVRFGLLRYDGSGVTMLALAIAAGAWLVVEAAFDIRTLRTRRSQQATATAAATVALALLCFPAVLLGAVHGWGLL